MQFGIHEIQSWDFENFKKTNFYSQYKELLDQPKGLGFWAWKAYIILEAFNSINDNDIVIYSDCGHEIIADLQPLIDICQKSAPILLFENGNLDNASWTKRDCFIRMNCDSKKYWYGKQVDASFALFRKSKLTINFLEEWLTFCCDWQANTNNINSLGKSNLPSFIEHRWDQSILSLLSIKWNIELYRMPSQFGNHYKLPEFRIKNEFNCKNQFNPKQLSYYSTTPLLNSPYFQLLNHHRTKKQTADNNDRYVKHISTILGYPKRLVKRMATLLHKNLSR